MVQDNSSIIAEVNKIKIGFTDKEITSYGGYSLLAKFFEKIELRENIGRILPIQERSPNSIGLYTKIVALTLIVFAGGNRFSHLLYLGSKKSLEHLFGIKRLPAAATTLTRLFNKIQGLSLAEKFSHQLWSYMNRLLPWRQIQQDWLGFDSTVIERYGAQEGSRKGYNPKKHGRPCHHPLIAFLNKSGYVVNLWNRSGNVHSGNNICAFFQASVERIASCLNIEGVLADSGFYDRPFIEMLEKLNKIYIIAVRLYSPVQEKIHALQQWNMIAEGIEISEFFFKHRDWQKERRYVVTRQNIERRPTAAGKQLKLFEETKEYRYSVWITSSKEEAVTVWHRCKERANDENTIRELKEDFALGGFCMQKFYATEAAMLVRVLIYNLFVLFRTVVMEQKDKIERLKTLRYKFFVIPAHLGRRGNQRILRLAVKTQAIKQKLTAFFSKIQQCVFDLKSNCNAFENLNNKTVSATG